MTGILDDLMAALDAPTPGPCEVDPMLALEQALSAEPPEAPSPKAETIPLRVRLCDIDRGGAQQRQNKVPDEVDVHDLTRFRKFPATRHANIDANACRRLWISVLHTCLRDTIQEYAKDLGQYELEAARNEGRRAIASPTLQWIGSKDFYGVCALAGFDGEALESRILPRLQTSEGCVALTKVLDKTKLGQSEATQGAEGRS